MSNSLKDQLLGLGFSAPKPEPRKPQPSKKTGQGGKHAHAQANRKPGGKPAPHKPQLQKGMRREDIDLAKAYAIRAQKEKDERIEAERLKQEEARLRREAKAKLAGFLVGKSLNAGLLGVVQQDGRYLLVDADVLAQAEAIFAPAVALKVDPNAPSQDDPYSDPKYQVPDDLTW